MKEDLFYGNPLGARPNTALNFILKTWLLIVDITSIFLYQSLRHLTRLTFHPSFFMSKHQPPIDHDDLAPPQQTSDGVYTPPPLFPVSHEQVKLKGSLNDSTTPTTSPSPSSSPSTSSSSSSSRASNNTNVDTNKTNRTIEVKLDAHHEHLNEQKAKLADNLSSLSHSELIHQVVEAQYALHEWRHTCSDLLSVVALSPEMTDAFYARSLRELLKAALESLDSVDCLRHLECSMPSVSTERPFIDVLRWDGLHYSEWKMQWAPKSWWISVSADGSRWGLAFNCLANVSCISLSGRIQCAFSPDLTSLRLRFMDKPSLNMRVETSVGWGIVPLPVQQSIQDIIKSKIQQVVDIRLRNPQGMVTVLRRKPLQAVSESDLYEAMMQAKRANEVQLRSSTFF